MTKLTIADLADPALAVDDRDGYLARKIISGLDDFTLQYIETALWSSHDESNNAGGEPMDKNYSIDDMAPETLDKIAADCRRFQELNGHLFILANVKRPTQGSATEAAGHDFWLTRVGHGAGFWDGDWEEPASFQLDESAKAFGSVDLYVGDDGKIYQM